MRRRRRKHAPALFARLSNCAASRRPARCKNHSGRRERTHSSSELSRRANRENASTRPATTFNSQPGVGVSRRPHCAGPASSRQRTGRRRRSAGKAAEFRLGAVCLLLALASSCDLKAATTEVQACSPVVRAPRSAAAATTTTTNEESRTPSVSTKLGTFKGILMPERHSRGQSDGRHKVVGFLGIRYASAPLKRLRFMPPAPFRHAANQLHDATRFGAICIQRWPGAELGGPFNSTPAGELRLRLLAKTMSAHSFNYLRPLLGRLTASEQSEDCLNLNIYAPLQVVRRQRREERTTKLLPVLVIIHGESFDSGAGSAYEAHRLLQLGAQMLAVTFNYRLNVFGFLPKLSGASRGNLGLMDQIAALHWIRDNIGAFGGSAANVTLMGTRRAALFVNLLMVSPMAKGLFQRAIMEDGSALSPLTANQVAPHHQHSNAVQHLRILAKLCDCPASSGSHSSRASLADNLSQTNSPANLVVAVDDAKANAQMLDCLRYKPATQIAQQIPLDLLQLDPSGGDSVMIQPRWQTRVRSLLSAANLTTINIHEAIRIEHLAQIIEQLNLREASQDLADSGGELFEAIHGHAHQASSGSIVRPLFGPVVDGSIVVDEDFAVSILKETDPSFAQKDLLIGFSHPVLRGLRPPGEVTATSSSVGALLGGSQLEVDNYLSERISASQERQGLSNEQAISLVNAFVRTFYRYHNQEIANSILNHYLSLAASNVWQQQQSSSTDSLGNADDSAATTTTTTTKLQRRRQEFLLASISRLFRDSLTDVPLFKLALIHSVKQMDSLLDAFVSKLFDQWRAAQQPSISAESQRHLSGAGSGINISQIVGHKSLLESFTAFGRHHLDRPVESLPPQWRHLSAAPKTASTFLYQSDQSALGSKSLRAAIERILAKGRSNWPTNTWTLIGSFLGDLASAIQGFAPQKVTLECSHYPSDVGADNLDAAQLDVVAHIEDWLCSRRVGKILTGFVVAGDVNLAEDDSSHRVAGEQLLDENLINVESNQCSLAADVRSRTDHHLVQPSVASDGDGDGRVANSLQLSTGCKRHLLTLLTDELDRSEHMVQPVWSNFNIFSQQIATLTNEDPAAFWRINGISEFANEPSGLLAKASFWSNFIPALNCNKTQPLTPAALLDGSGLNSSLLNLNIQFTCHQGSRTAQDHIESIVSAASQRLELRKSQWRQSRLANLQPPDQNHHSLRMANMSQSGGTDDGVDAIDEHNSTNVGPNWSSSALNESELITTATTRTADLRSNRVTGFVLILCALVVGVTLASGTYVAIKRRSRDARRRDQTKRPPTNQQPAPTRSADEQSNLVKNSPSGDSDLELRPDLGEASGEQTFAAQTADIQQADWLDHYEAGRLSQFGLEQEVGLGDAVLQQQYQLDNNHSFAGASGASQCRSHSALSLASQLHSANSFVNLGAFNGLQQQPLSAYALEAKAQESIVLPALESNSRQRHELSWRHTLDTRRHNYLEDNLSSSIETQNGRSSRESSAAAAAAAAPTGARKRVKINEPLSIMKANGRRRAHADGQPNCGRQTNQSQRIAGHYNQEPKVQLCPIHSRSQPSQYLATESGYILNDTNEYLTINNPGTWLSGGHVTNNLDQLQQ